MPRAYSLKKSLEELATMELSFPMKTIEPKGLRSHPANLPYYPTSNNPWPPIGLPSVSSADTSSSLDFRLRQPLALKNPESLWLANNFPVYAGPYIAVSHASSGLHWNLPVNTSFRPFASSHPHVAITHALPSKPKSTNTPFDIDTILGRSEEKKCVSEDEDDEEDDVEMASIEQKPERKTQRFQCSECKKSYSTMSGLKKHKEFHCTVLHQQSFHCKFCDKMYGTIGALKMHLRTHTLPNQCTVCGRRFSRPWLLQGHMRTHSGEKPFQCPQCLRPFADRSNLRAHLQTHADIKKYKCSICLKTFSRMSLLNKHQSGSCRPASHPAVEGTLV